MNLTHLVLELLHFPILEFDFEFQLIVLFLQSLVQLLVFSDNILLSHQCLKCRMLLVRNGGILVCMVRLRSAGTCGHGCRLIPHFR